MDHDALLLWLRHASRAIDVARPLVALVLPSKLSAFPIRRFKQHQPGFGHIVAIVKLSFVPVTSCGKWAAKAGGL